jgi:hypothetical protein
MHKTYYQSSWVNRETCQAVQKQQQQQQSHKGQKTSVKNNIQAK